MMSAGLAITPSSMFGKRVKAYVRLKHVWGYPQSCLYSEAHVRARLVASIEFALSPRIVGVSVGFEPHTLYSDRTRCYYYYYCFYPLGYLVLLLLLLLLTPLTPGATTTSGIDVVLMLQSPLTDAEEQNLINRFSQSLRLCDFICISITWGSRQTIKPRPSLGLMDQAGWNNQDGSDFVA